MTWLGRRPPATARPPSGPVLFLAVLAGHLVLAVSASYLFDGYRGYPIPWPANGVVLAALVLTPPRRWGWALAAGGLSESLSSAWFGLSAGWAQAYAAVNLLQVVGAAVLFRRWCPDRDLGTRRGLVAFVAAALVIAAGAGGAAGAGVATLDYGTEWWPTFGFYWAGDAIGSLVAGGTIVAWGRASQLPAAVRRGRWRAVAEWVAALVLVTALAAASTVLGSRPVGYLALVGMLWAALRLGVRGALTSALVVTYVQGSLVVSGWGVFADRADSLPAALAYLTVFLIVASLAAWVLAVEVGHGQAAERREATERQARHAAEALVARLARLRAFADAVSRATTRDDVVAAWHAHAPHLLDGRDHRLVLAGRDGGADAGMGSPSARALAEGRVVASVGPAGRAAGPGSDAGTETVVAAPLLAGGRVLGVLSSVHDGDATGDPVRREEAAAAAARLAEALVRVGLFAEAVDSARRLTVLQDLTSRLGRAPTTEAVVSLVLGAARREFGAHVAGLLLPDASGALRPHPGSDPPPPGLPLVVDAGTRAARDGSPIEAAPRYGPSVDGGAPPPGEPAPGSPDPPDPGVVSWAVLPLVVNRRLRGLAWYAWESGRGFAPEDRTLHAAFAAQCAAALRRVAATDVEHEAAVKLQQALLPRSFPAVEGMAAAARYVPSSEALSVGGDWYEVVARPDGRSVVIVGDVVGHDVTAAAAMGQLRSALATVAVEAADPAAAVEQIHGFPGGPAIGFATALYADFDPVTGLLRYACAGHPPPLLVKPWGEAEFLTAGRSGPLFAVGPARPQRPGTVAVPPGSLLVCYTDGLVERRDRRFHEGLVALARACLAHRRRPLPEFTDQVLADLTAGRVLADDVALLCAVLTPRGVGESRSGTPAAAAAASPVPRPTRA